MTFLHTLDRLCIFERPAPAMQEDTKMNRFHIVSASDVAAVMATAAFWDFVITEPKQGSRVDICMPCIYTFDDVALGYGRWEVSPANATCVICKDIV